MAKGPGSCFFYGTLMNAKILSAVIGRSSRDLDVRPAILPDHTRHHVFAVDYPGVVSVDVGRKVMGRELTADESCVRGTVVKGLTHDDISVLDVFEGNEYERRPCKVELASDSGEALNKTVPASVYIWIAPPSRLRPLLWSYEAFVRDNLRHWVDTSENGDKYLEIDRRNAMGGVITPPEDEVEFGHALRDKYWSFELGYINLNGGSYGTCPKPVMETFRRFQDQAERAPDKFFRRDYVPLLDKCRAELATVVDCDAEDLVMVPNATHGIYTVFQSIEWQKGDRMLYYPSSVYNACANILHHTISTRPHLDLSLVPVEVAYPCSTTALLAATKLALEGARKDGKGKVKLALFDAISSQPGVIVPWEKLCQLFRDEGVLSVVDAAHALGTRRIRLRETRPDFWIANAHKWLFVHRGCGVLYVARQHQSRVHSVPVGHAYPVPTPGPNKHTIPSTESSSFLAEFAWPGTQDFSAIASLPAALAFRRRIGGESAIMNWCDQLARQGGRKVASMWATEVMESAEGELTGPMVNVRLPLGFRQETVDADRKALTFRLMDEYNCFAVSYVHDGKWWTRFSASVFNEVFDFVYVARSLQDICRDLERSRSKSA